MLCPLNNLNPLTRALECASFSASSAAFSSRASLSVDTTFPLSSLISVLLSSTVVSSLPTFACAQP